MNRMRKRIAHAAVAAVVILGGLAAGSMPALGVDNDRWYSGCGGLIAYNEYPTAVGLDATRLMVVPVNGGAPRQLWDLPNSSQAELDPAWSPDGKAVTFVGRTMDEGFPVQNRLYVLREGAVDPEVLIDQQLPGYPVYSRHPVWSPDGSKIAYASSIGPAGLGFRGLVWLRILDIATRTDVVLTEIGAGYGIVDLAWSPRGDQFLISGLNRSNFHWTVWTVRPDPSDPRLTVLVSDDDTGAPPSTGFPTFLPHTQTVLVERDEPDGTGSRLYVADSRLRHLIPVTPKTGWESQPDFGTSSLEVVYQQYSGDPLVPTIAVLNLLTRNSRTLVPHTQDLNVEYPDWQPVSGCRR